MIDVMKSSKTYYARRVCRWLAIIAVVLIGLHLLLQQVNLNVFHQQNGYFFELSNRFDMDDESSVPTWFSQCLFLLIAATALLAVKLEKQRIKRVLWGVISTLGLVLAIDEVAGIHEQILQTIHVLLFQDSATTILENAWLVVLPFVLIAMALLGRQMIRHFPMRLIVVAGTGISVFLLGAVGVDIFTQGLDMSSLSLEFMQQGLFVGTEEGLELCGTIIILYSIVEYIELHYHNQVTNGLAALKS